MIYNLRNFLKYFSFFGNSHERIFVIRLYLILIFLSCCYFAIFFRLVDLNLTNVEDVPRIIFSTYDRKNVMNRGNILDRNGTILATNIPAASLYAHPFKILDYRSAAYSICSVLSDIKEEELFHKFNSGKKFIWIKRHLSPREQQQIHNLGIPGLDFFRDERRFYPHKKLFSHLLGFVDIDNQGLAGLEKAFDYKLQSTESRDIKKLIKRDRDF